MEFSITLNQEIVEVSFHEEVLEQASIINLPLNNIIFKLEENKNELEAVQPGEEFMLVGDFTLTGTKHSHQIVVERLLTNVL